MKQAVWITFSFALLLGTNLLSADPAATSAADDPWPGYVANGRYFRSLEWGVAFWGPGNASQQLQQGDPAALVRYSSPATKGKPGYVITVLGAKLKDDLPADQILAQATEGIRKVFGNKLTGLKTTSSSDEKLPPLAIGRIVCQTPTPPGVTGKESGLLILRHYVYLRLRAKQHLAIVAETSPAGGAEVAAIVDSLARSVAVFDPQAESAQTADAAERTAKLLAAMQPADWEALARKAKPQWFQLCARPKGPEGPADPRPDAGENKSIGWLYSSTARRGPAQIESVTSVQITQAETIVSSYVTATIDLATGEETIRQWTQSTRKAYLKTGLEPALPGIPVETFLLAHRNGGEETRGTAAGSDKFDITTAVGGREKKFVRRIPSLPYLPAALHDLLLARVVEERGKTFGAFRFLDGEVIFETIQPQYLAKIFPGGGRTSAVRFLLRHGVTQPVVLRYTDPDGNRTLRERTTPNAWMEAVEDSDGVPADLRANLTRPPSWP